MLFFQIAFGEGDNLLQEIFVPYGTVLIQQYRMGYLFPSLFRKTGCYHIKLNK
jgi:hypothetical protein